MRVLVVEDDIELQGQLSRMLEHSGFQVNLAADGQEGLYYATDYDIDVAIIDLGLPKMDGLELINRIRDKDLDFPILVLTARSGWRAKVQGLDSGADDYLTKPFQPEELMARVNALLRRASGKTHTKIVHGPLALDLKKKTVLNGDLEMDLTAFEYKVLEHFMMHPKVIVNKARLVDCLYDYNEEKDSNVIEVIIARLRKKLELQAKFKPIETLRGRGYRFNPDNHDGSG